MPLWRRFLNGHPVYLARHYWWAYLWQKGVWFFDHQPIINAILFGQYKKLLNCTIALIAHEAPKGRFLQLTCVYGKLTPKLLRSMKQKVHLTDVAQIQLQTTRNKLTEAERTQLLAARMNAEQLAYCDNAFATILMFFLLHEMPASAREHTLHEVLRTLQPGGRLIIVEYAPCPKHHLLWRFTPARALLTRLEPFLASFWQDDLLAMLQQAGKQQGKQVSQTETHHFFASFYRISEFRIT